MVEVKMNEIMQPTNRRTVLQRCVLFVAGALGMPLATTGSQAEPPSPEPDPKPEANNEKVLRLYATRLMVHSQSQKPGELPAWNGRLHSRTDLLDRPNGAKVGEFSGSCFGPESHFGCAGSDHAMELQTLKLKEGTLFGMGASGPTASGDRVHAVIGGTGRFAGARGSYVIRQGQPAAKASVEFVITLLT